jgi:hypothetical protein
MRNNRKPIAIALVAAAAACTTAYLVRRKK